MVTLYHMMTVYLYLSNWVCAGQGSRSAHQRSIERHHVSDCERVKGQLAKLSFGMPVNNNTHLVGPIWVQNESNVKPQK